MKKSLNKRSPLSCIVCGNRDPSISYFKVPKEESKRSLWLTNCNLNDPDLYISPNAKVCENHFSDNSFSKNINDVLVKRRITRTAVPSVNINNENCSTTQQLSIKLLKSMKTCFVCGFSKDSTERSFHRFPKNIELRKKWLENLDMADVSPLPTIEKRLCNLHFNEEDIVLYPVTGRRGLKSDAMPLKISGNDGAKFICEPKSLQPVDTFSANQQKQHDLENNTTLTCTDNEIAVSQNSEVCVSLSSTAPENIQSNIASSEELNNEDVIICEDLSKTQIIDISDEENIPSASNVSTRKRKLTKTLNRSKCSESTTSSSNFQPSSSSAQFKSSPIYHRKESLDKQIIYISDDETSSNDMSLNLSNNPAQNNKNNAMKTEFSTKTSPFPCKKEKKMSFNSNVLCGINLNVTESMKKPIKAATIKKCKRILKRKEKRRLKQQKLIDFQNVFNDLLRGDMVTKKGRKMIRKMMKKYSTT